MYTAALCTQLCSSITIMDAMPQATRSSNSPNPHRRSHYEYPPPVQQHNAKLSSRQATANQAGERYDCRVEGLMNDYGHTMLPLPSSTSTSNWSNTALLPERSSQPSPNILSAEYDPFAPFHSDIPTSYDAPHHRHLYPTRSAETSMPPTSPSLSGVDSHRSSFSSAPASETYSHSEPYQAFHPRIKMEDQLEWPSENSSSLMLASSHLDNSNLAASASPYPGCLEATYFHQPGTIGWPKTTEYSDGIGRLESNATGRQQSAEARKLLGNVVTRTRTPRKMTTREDANFQCKAKGCGKLFSRSYNFKAHMETHDTGRVYPFPCPLPDCNKKFVRKTDLQRHHQSVHMKERNYQCDFCSRYFARKDTLRR